jgi:predicted O-linked N-acetylglucosamine transferase (SPINDLY family)
MLRRLLNQLLGGRGSAQTAAPEAAMRLLAEGDAHLAAKRAGAALACYEQACRLAPGTTPPHRQRAAAFYYLGDIDAARSEYDAALAATPDDALRIQALLVTLPQIYRSTSHLQQERQRFCAELSRLEAMPLSVADPYRDIGTTAFFLCYQGEDDAELQRRLGALMLKACPSLAYQAAPPVRAEAAAPGTRLRVGVVSAFLNAHVIGSWFNGLVAALAADPALELVLFSLADTLDEGVRHALDAHGRIEQLPRTLPAARTAIERAQLDALIYTDVGMKPFTAFLAQSRLAPVQALLAGHPVTGGIAAIDYYLSSRLQEPEDAQLQYTEKLILLEGIPAVVTRPRIPEPSWTREQLGFAPGRNVYACPQRLQKLHPDFDAALAAILRLDAEGVVLLFEDQDSSDWGAQLRERFATSMPDVLERVRFRPWASRPGEFVSILAQADALLDPFHFTGGATSYLAFAAGAPLVTWPGRFFRGRMTYGMYRRMAVLDCVAPTMAAYPALAVRLATDRAWRNTIRERIRGASAVLFDNTECVPAITRFLHEAAAAAKQHGPPTVD